VRRPPPRSSSYLRELHLGSVLGFCRPICVRLQIRQSVPLVPIPFGSICGALIGLGFLILSLDFVSICAGEREKLIARSFNLGMSDGSVFPPSDQCGGSPLFDRDLAFGPIKLGIQSVPHTTQPASSASAAMIGSDMIDTVARNAARRLSSRPDRHQLANRVIDRDRASNRGQSGILGIRRRLRQRCPRSPQIARHVARPISSPRGRNKCARATIASRLSIAGAAAPQAPATRLRWLQGGDAIS
jgi:hypothetical protein